MLSAMIKSAASLISVLCLASIVSADYVRFSIKEIQSIEPREWDTDHLWANLNLVTQNQNVTQRYVFDDWPRGRHTTPEDVYKDITISSGDPNLTLAFAIYNVGDGDPQKIGLMITSLILDIPSRIPILGGIAFAVNAVLDMFKGSYQCEGPVAVTVSQLSQQNLQEMAYDQLLCKSEEFVYETQKGCVDVNPFSTKKTGYSVRHCVEKHSGESTAGGGTPRTSGVAGRYARIEFVRCVILVGAFILLMGF